MYIVAIGTFVVLYNFACGFLWVGTQRLMIRNRPAIRYCESANADIDASYECAGCGKKNEGRLVFYKVHPRVSEVGGQRVIL